MVFQSYAIWPHMTVFENAAFPLEVGDRRYTRQQVREKVMRVLTTVHLDELATREATKLSGGQQQRLALARALVMEPQLLLLDEPMSNLDAKLRERMRFELKRIQADTGVTTVYVTHDQAEALALSDMVAVIHGGKLQQYGTPQEVYARPANRIVADFMGLVNLVPGKVSAAIGGTATIEAAGGLKLLVTQTDGFGTGDSVDVSIRPENIRLASPGLSGSGGVRGTITERTFLGNISEYYASLDSGPTLRVQTHPAQVFAVGDQVTIDVDAALCTVFRSNP
jgi:iron(III) transport system ATP-binding protein